MKNRDFRVGDTLQFVDREREVQTGIVKSMNKDGSVDITVGGVWGTNTRNGHTRLLMGGRMHTDVLAGNIIRKVR